MRVGDRRRGRAPRRRRRRCCARWPDSTRRRWCSDGRGRARAAVRGRRPAPADPRARRGAGWRAAPAARRAPSRPRRPRRPPRCSTCRVARRSSSPPRRSRTAAAVDGLPGARPAAASTGSRSSSSRAPAGTTSCCPAAPAGAAARARRRRPPPRDRARRLGLRATARSRGLGTAALFAGPSGTGKTLAAEVVAAELGARPRRRRPQPGRQQVHRRDREEPRPRLRRRRGQRGRAALRRGRRAVRQAHRGARQPRPLRQPRGRLPAAAHRGLPRPGDPHHQREGRASTRRSCAACASSSRSPTPTQARARRCGAARSRRATPAPGLDPRRLAAIDLPGGGIAAAALTAAYLGAERGEVTAEDVGAATRWELAKHGRTIPGALSRPRAVTRPDRSSCGVRLRCRAPAACAAHHARGRVTDGHHTPTAR